jgi:hypothetical protein
MNQAELDARVVRDNYLGRSARIVDVDHARVWVAEMWLNALLRTLTREQLQELLATLSE